METRAFQNLCAEIVEKIDKKYKIERDQHFSFVQLMEEVGELARAINRPKLRNKKLDQDNINEEFADVFLQLAILAKMYKVDFEEVVKTKSKELEKRHRVDFSDAK